MQGHLYEERELTVRGPELELVLSIRGCMCLLSLDVADLLGDLMLPLPVYQLVVLAQELIISIHQIVDGQQKLQALRLPLEMVDALVIAQASLARQRGFVDDLVLVLLHLLSRAGIDEHEPLMIKAESPGKAAYSYSMINIELSELPLRLFEEIIDIKNVFVLVIESNGFQLPDVCLVARPRMPVFKPVLAAILLYDVVRLIVALTQDQVADVVDHELAFFWEIQIM